MDGSLTSGGDCHFMLIATIVKFLFKCAFIKDMQDIIQKMIKNAGEGSADYIAHTYCFFLCYLFYLSSCCKHNYLINEV